MIALLGLQGKVCDFGKDDVDGGMHLQYTTELFIFHCSVFQNSMRGLMTE